MKLEKLADAKTHAISRLFDFPAWVFLADVSVV